VPTAPSGVQAKQTRKLIVHPDAVLTGPIAAQRFKSNSALRLEVRSIPDAEPFIAPVFVELDPSLV
jgi:hypothetical protein